MENNDEFSKKPGLLNKAQKILADVTPAFDVWLKRNGIKRAIILSTFETSKDKFYYVTDSYGINAENMARFHETAEFWNETLSKAFEWQCFSSDFNELEKFSTFFEENFFLEINKIFFLPFGNPKKPYIFVTVELNEDDDLSLNEASLVAVQLKNIKEFQNLKSKTISKLEKNIEKGLEISSSRLFILSLKNWIEDAIKDIPFSDADLKNAVIEGIADSACVNITPLIRQPNCIHSGKNGEIKIVLYAKEDPDEELIAYHISRSLENFLGKPTKDDRATFLAAGICQNKKGTIMFLTQD